MQPLTIFQKILLSVTILGSVAAFASDKYKCTVPVNQEIGIGLEADIEVLSSTSANLNVYKTSDLYPKISEVLIQNPGTAVQVGNVLQIRNGITSIQNPSMTGVSQVDFDLSAFTFKFDQTDMSLPCAKVESF